MLLSVEVLLDKTLSSFCLVQDQLVNAQGCFSGTVEAALLCC